MVNSVEAGQPQPSALLAPAPLTKAKRLVGAYVAVTFGTLAALAVMTVAAPSLATSEAWGHSVIVAVFAVVLVLRTRAALKGSRTGIRALTVIGGVLLVVNLLEAALPGVFPAWMRVEMLVIAAMMLTLAILSVQARRNPPAGRR
ncbi:hypothetical protein [Streptomyces sp. MST-110588]|uniref:hypothetical protein n=1 Tax=Streptomyces sp. MST-110588 TaxID=2833628 RepID=UPI001F5CEEBD|nr:hypothetical protein [Streptomyces sp. MST-110588]UNO38434.1 hypothetical protein KGS77_00675 [Streptomyces sp. MST-110588]